MPKGLFSQAATERNVFLDERFLYPEFIPEKLPHRDNELDSLAYCFRPILQGRKPMNIFLAGPTGVGKTVCAKYVLRELEQSHDRAKSIYLNCFEYNCRPSVLAAIANFIGAVVPRRGLATDEIFTKLVESLRKCSFTPIVVLDEVDQLMLTEDNAKLLYDLLRIVEYEKLRLGIVMISNDSELTAKLDPRIRSSLAEQTLIFEPYTPSQLKSILSERAEKAFVKGALEKDVIGVAAANAGKSGGDCRVALESLLKAGRAAERANTGKVTVADLKGAFADVGAVSLLKGLKHLAKDELELLRIIAQSQPVLSGKIHEIYSSKKGNELKERRLREILAKLEKQGLVLVRAISLGNMGKSKEYSVSAPKDMLLKEIDLQSK